MKRHISAIAVVVLAAGACYGHTWMTQWTPGGWTTCLGAGLSHGHIPIGEVCGEVFLLDSQAREQPEAYRRVLRAEWFAEVMGEEEADGMIPGSGGFWHSVAYRQRQDIAAGAESPTPREPTPVADLEVKAAEKEITRENEGVITIPVGSCLKTEADASTAVFMRGASGELQMHLPRQGKTPAKAAFKCVVDIGHPGKYELSARVVTIHNGVGMYLSINGRDTSIEMNMPYTGGEWKYCEPVELDLVAGLNTLVFSAKPGSNGVTIKQFTLTAP